MSKQQEREREREAGRQANRQADRQTDRKNRQTEKQTDRETEKQREEEAGCRELSLILIVHGPGFDPPPPQEMSKIFTIVIVHTVNDLTNHY